MTLSSQARSGPFDHGPEDHAGGAHRPLTRRDYRTMVLAALGGTLDFYDFIIFAFFVTVLGHLFFPPEIPEWLQQFQTFGIFAAGYFARPFGGMVMAHFGDRFGRKTVFTFSILLMSLATLGIAVLPTYADVGTAAPILLLVLRVLQGASIGGELPGAWTFAAEHVPANRIGLACSVLSTGLAAGALLGSLVAAAISREFTAEAIGAYAWRLPFVLGGIFGLVAMFLRRWIVETPVFREMQQSRSLAREMPLKLVLREHLGDVVLSTAVISLLAAAIGVVVLMTPILLQTRHHVVPDIAFTAGSLATLAICFGGIVAGLIFDRIGEAGFLVGGGLLLALVACLFYSLLPMETAALYAFYSLLGLCVGIVGPLPAVLINRFPPAIRFTGVSFAYNLANAVVGGLTPLIVTLGLHFTLLAPAYYLTLACAVVVVAGIVIWRKADPDLDQATSDIAR